ncbi:MAG: response regulator receiver domain [Bacteroidota bacterium]
MELLGCPSAQADADTSGFNEEADLRRLEHAFLNAAIVEDEESTANEVANRLMEAGVYVRCVKVDPAAKDAYKRAADECAAADLVVLDWRLRDMGELAKIIVRRCCEAEKLLPILVYTRHPDEVVLDCVGERQGPLVKVFAKDDGVTPLVELVSCINERCGFGVRLGLMWKSVLKAAVDRMLRDVLDLSDEVCLLWGIARHEDGQDAGEAMLQLLWALTASHTDSDAEGLAAIRKRACQFIDEILPEAAALDTPGGDAGPITGFTVKHEDLEMALKLSRLIMYETVPDSSQCLTGDIFRLPERRYGSYTHAIVITPRCDMVNRVNRAPRPVDPRKVEPAATGLSQQEGVKVLLGKTIGCIVREKNPEGDEKKDARTVKDLLLEPGDKRYVLPDVGRRDEDLAQLVFDFGSVDTLPSTDDLLAPANRIVRLRSPFIDDLLAAYARFHTRVGIPTFCPPVRARLLEKSVLKRIKDYWIDRATRMELGKS